MQRMLTLLIATIVGLVLHAPTHAQEPGFGRFDYGKMWTFDHAPTAYFQEAYDLDLSPEWFERARLGTLRIPGCTASFVSATGLVLTNHHCARGAVAAVSAEGENLLDEGFVAADIAGERPIAGFIADQLVWIGDVTSEISDSLASGQTDAERASKRSEAEEAITNRLLEDYGDGHAVEIISFYGGSRQSAYVFRRFDDVRLVMAPELQIGYFGGDSDNFTYPRYSLDFSFLRVYQDGEPYRTEYFFPWSETGTSEGAPVFAVGNPGSTFRLETLSQLEYRRDVTDLQLLTLIETRIKAFERYLDGNSSAPALLQNRLFSLKNAQKLYRGRIRALNNQEIIARKKSAESALADSIAASPTLESRYGRVLEEIAQLQEARRKSLGEAGAFNRLTPGFAFNSAIERRALIVADHLAGVGDVESALDAVSDLPWALDAALFKARLDDFTRYLSDENHPTADEILSGTVLGQDETLRAALADGTDLAADPAVAWVMTFRERLVDYRSSEAGFGAKLERMTSMLGQVRLEVLGTAIPPDATFSLRLSDGVVSGYEYNGTYAMPFTTMFGMMDRSASHRNAGEWQLPERWRTASLDLSTPLNFVSTADITGGNSGSPVVNQRLELVGLIFDGNIESLSGDFIYLDERERSVSVDARGILEALKKVYQANYVVEELTAGELVLEMGGSR